MCRDLHVKTAVKVQKKPSGAANVVEKCGHSVPCHRHPYKNAVKVALNLTAKNAVRIALADCVKIRVFRVFEFLACKNAAENAHPCFDL